MSDSLCAWLRHLCTWDTVQATSQDLHYLLQNLSGLARIESSADYTSNAYSMGVQVVSFPCMQDKPVSVCKAEHCLVGCHETSL